MGVGVALAWCCFGSCLVGDGGGGVVVERAVWAVVVVDLDETAEMKGLQLGDGGRLGLGAEPSFEGLLEAFDFAAGGWMVRSRVLLDDVQADQFGFEGVTATTPAGVAVENTMPLSVNVDAGRPWSSTAVRNVVSTARAVTRR